MFKVGDEVVHIYDKTHDVYVVLEMYTKFNYKYILTATGYHTRFYSDGTNLILKETMVTPLYKAIYGVTE